MIETSDEQANELALKQRFVDRAKALANQPEVYRGRLVTQLICDTVAFGVRAEAEIFQAAYGDPSGRKYWEAHLSESIPVFSLAYKLSVHLPVTAENLDYQKFAILCAFRDAAKAGECWFTGETTPLLAVEQYGSVYFGLEKVKVDPRAAVEWLLSKPKREHLVPKSLRRFLQSDGEPADAEAPTRPRPVTKKTAERFVASYIDGEKAAERHPTLVRLEAAAKEAKLRGGREYLRAAFRRSQGVKRGRPLKVSTKIAEK